MQAHYWAADFLKSMDGQGIDEMEWTIVDAARDWKAYRAKAYRAMSIKDPMSPAETVLYSAVLQWEESQP